MSQFMKPAKHPILKPTFELHCPECDAPANLFMPDYDLPDVEIGYDCECRWELEQLPYSKKIERLVHLWRTRVKTWRRLGLDYRDMALREYEITPENAEVATRVMNMGERDRVFLHGAGGRGKTHLMIRTMVELWSRGLTVEYWPEMQLYEKFQEYALSKDFYRVKPGREGDVLIIDDMGKTRPSEFSAQMMYELLEHRSANNLGLLITSNHDPAGTAGRMVLDAGNAGAVESRLRSGLVLELPGIDRRANRE